MWSARGIGRDGDTLPSRRAIAIAGFSDDSRADYSSEVALAASFGVNRDCSNLFPSANSRAGVDPARPFATYRTERIPGMEVASMRVPAGVSAVRAADRDDSEVANWVTCHAGVKREAAAAHGKDVALSTNKRPSVDREKATLRLDILSGTGDKHSQDDHKT